MGWSGLRLAASLTRFQNPASSALAPAGRLGKAVGQDGRIHGAGTRGADPLEGKPLLLEQPVEHAPGEGAVRTPALERQIDQLLPAQGGYPTFTAVPEALTISMLPSLPMTS